MDVCINDEWMNEYADIDSIITILLLISDALVAMSNKYREECKVLKVSSVLYILLSPHVPPHRVHCHFSSNWIYSSMMMMVIW